MKEFCFAELARCIQKSLQPPNDDKDVIDMLLGWIIDKPNVVDKKGNPLHVAPSLVSDLMNRKVDVPKAIKNACTTKQILKEAEQHCATNVIPFLNEVLSDDMYENIGRAVNNDENISDKMKKRILSYLETENYSEFLGTVIIYLINRENRISNSPVACEDIPLLTEAEFECPICHTPLIEYIKDTPVQRYSIVHIYPDNIVSNLSDFSNVKKPNRLDSRSNRIALCRDHAEEYMLEPTYDEYTKLLELKNRLSETYSSRIDINEASLEDDIQEVLYGLASITDDTVLEELPMEALRLDAKISPENHMLKNEQMAWVLRYYNYIDSLFSTMDRDGSGDFELIASEVRIAYKKLESRNLPQDDIVDQLAEWIKNKSGVGNKNKRACKIVVAYFIQNCEVFHEISK